MRLRVKDVLGDNAATAQAGEQLVEIIGPILAKGEPVVLDFADVRHIAAVFFTFSVGSLIYRDASKRVPELLSFENLPPLDQRILQSVVRNATLARDNPKVAEAMDRVAREFAQRD